MTGKRKPKKPDVLRAWFNYQLKLKGSSYSSVARRLGISRQSVQEGILNPSPRVAAMVAADLGKEPSDLWPTRYKGKCL